MVLSFVAFGEKKDSDFVEVMFCLFIKSLLNQTPAVTLDCYFLFCFLRGIYHISLKEGLGIY